MGFVFLSMPYARFDSRWFANVPNINLGVLTSLLSKEGRSAKAFHFHMEFIPHLRSFGREIEEKFVRLSQKFGVEYLSLDYVFASLLFQDAYAKSRERFKERLEPIGLSINDFEVLREVASSFMESAYLKLAPSLDDTELVGFSCSHYQLSGSLLMSSKIKEAHPDVPIILGGKDCAGSFSSELLSNVDFVDFIGIGEAEATVPSLLQHIDDGKSPLYNVIYRNKGGRIMASETKENVSLDSLPFPAYDFEKLPVPHSEIILPLELGRGCPWRKCTFCPDQAYNIRCQSKTVNRINAEVDNYQKISADLRNFFILDSDALKEPASVIHLSDYFKGKELTFHFAEFRAEKIDLKVVKALLDFGKWASPFQVGIETFSDRVLRLMRKGVSALKNVEVLKMVAEQGIPLQFNLFTCYPNMTTEDLKENLRVMDAIAHILVCKNIQVFPGEFYLPTDCPIFVNSDEYRVQKNTQSLFADIFEGFAMPSYSNYPYAYAFDNDEEQFNIANEIRRKVEEIKGKSPSENFMFCEEDPEGLRIMSCRDGQKKDYTLQGLEKEVYLLASEKLQLVDKLSGKLKVSPDTVRVILDDFEQKGLILYSSDKKAFLSLAMKG